MALPNVPDDLGSGSGPGSAVFRTRRGRVVRVEPGLVLCALGRTRVRATVCGPLLARIAGDPSAAPRPGDRVLLRMWGDGRVTVDRVVARSLPAGE